MALEEPSPLVGKEGELMVVPGTSLFPKRDPENKPEPDLESPGTMVQHMVLSNLAANSEAS